MGHCSCAQLPASAQAHCPQRPICLHQQIVLLSGPDRAHRAGHLGGNYQGNRVPVAQLAVPDRQMLLLGVQWMKYLSDIMHFVEREWPAIQLVSAVVSLPLSYLCMRGTLQP